jgi:hypothetical protein
MKTLKVKTAMESGLGDVRTPTQRGRAERREAVRTAAYRSGMSLHEFAKAAMDAEADEVLFTGGWDATVEDLVKAGDSHKHAVEFLSRMYAYEYRQVRQD